MGFFASAPVQTALIIGALVSAVSALVGVFAVLRRQSFAAHALADLGAVGGSAAFLLGISQLWGFVIAGLVAAGLMELVGLKRAQSRDVATGIIFGTGLGLTALFLYWDTTIAGASGAAISVLFGSLFVIDPGVIPLVLVLSVVATGIIVAIWRWLLVDSLSQDLAAVRGIPVRLVGVLFLVALALAVELSALTIGAVLSTALTIGPAAAALRVTRRIGWAAVVAIVIGVGSTWAGILVSYESYYWSPGHTWPVSFCIVAVVFLAYLATGAVAALTRRRDRPCASRWEHRVFSDFMLNTWITASAVAVVAGVVGFFVVLRGETFLAHALPHGAFAGAAGAVLLGVDPIVGLGVFAVGGALVVTTLGRRARSDVVTALTLVVMLALGALFLSLGGQYSSEVFALLFGQILGVGSTQVLPIVVLGMACVAAVIVAYRPLLLASVLPEMARARGISLVGVSVFFSLVVALATTMSVPVVGALLMFSLLVGPPAAARSFTANPLAAIPLSVGFALVTVWASIAAAYQTNLPIGFFVTLVSAILYGAGRLWFVARGRGARRTLLLRRTA